MSTYISRYFIAVSQYFATYWSYPNRPLLQDAIPNPAPAFRRQAGSVKLLITFRTSAGLARVRGIGSAADTREPAIVQTRRAETLPGFRFASPLHKEETPGEAPGVGVFGFLL
jgi:hypothetical protein